MRTKTGAGASVSSGASYQARIGAYLIGCQILELDVELAVSGAVARISFETMEAVDDINLHLLDSSNVYIQAKAIISFSLAAGGELRSVLDQFYRQRRCDGDRLVLVTTSRSSKKVTYELRAALEAYRDAPEKNFYRDQPKALTEVVNALKATLKDLGATDEADSILRMMSVQVLDVEDNDPIEQAIILAIQARNFLAADAVWGKLISDCVTFSKSRRTVDPADIANAYQRFLRSEVKGASCVPDDVLRIELSGGDFATAREVLLCEVVDDANVLPKGLYVIELYRFDEECNERIGINDEEVTLGSGAKMKLLRRAATFEGINRLLEREPERWKNHEITLVPINSEEDFEQGECAKVHKAKLDQIVGANENPLACVHCGNPVFSTAAHTVEIGSSELPRVGLCHHACLLPADRVLGAIKSDLFDEHPELIDFDINGWFRAAHGGQMVFAAADYLQSSGDMHLGWGGEEAKGPPGDFVVEVSLLNGDREIVTVRNGVHRFAEAEAIEFAGRLNETFEKHRQASNPMCYSDETKTFGPRSRLLEMIGTKETFRPIDKARVRRYDATFAARYERPGQWYAPLLYLRRNDTEKPVDKRSTAFLLTEPLKLRTFVENWTDAGMDLGNYRTEALLTDAEFDEFMRWNEDRGYSAIVNPILDPATGELLSGRSINSLSRIAGAQSHSIAKVQPKE